MSDLLVPLSGDPFSDTKVNFDFPDEPIHLGSLEGKTLTPPDKVTVPIIASVPPIPPHSRSSSISTASDAGFTSRLRNTPESDPAPTEWSNADLHYLVSILYPDQVVQNQLLFSPPLETLQDLPGPIHLHLFVRVPVERIPSAAFSRHAPIGTGRPISQVLLAESGHSCLSAAAARASLAESLLDDRCTVNAICAQYNLMAALHSCSDTSLQSVMRGMLAMADASDGERQMRMSQLQNVVDDKWEFEPRLEIFLLEAGSGELGGWIACVEIGLGLEKEERDMWAGVYRDAGGFLRKACKV